MSARNEIAHLVVRQIEYHVDRPLHLRTKRRNLDRRSRIIRARWRLEQTLRDELRRLWACPHVGDIRQVGLIAGIELVKDKLTKEPFPEAGKLVYQKAFRKGLAWIPAGHILRMSPAVVMEDEVLLKGLDLIDEAIGETEKAFGY